MIARGDDPPKPAPAPAPVVVQPGATVKVTPKGDVPPGTLVTIDGTTSVGDTFLWDTDVDPMFYSPDSGGKKYFFATPAPGDYTFRLDSFEIIEGKIKAARAKVTITVKAPTPPVVDPPVVVPPVVTPPVVTPPAPVGPTPTPSPAPTPGTVDKLGMTAFTRSLVTAMTWTPTQLTWRQSTLAPVFDAEAKAAAGAPTLQGAVTAAGIAIETAIGAAQYPAWKATVIGPIQTQLAGLSQSGKISTTADLSEAFAEISAGLKGN